MPILSADLKHNFPEFFQFSQNCFILDLVNIMVGPSTYFDSILMPGNYSSEKKKILEFFQSQTGLFFGRRICWPTNIFR